MMVPANSGADGNESIHGKVGGQDEACYCYLVARDNADRCLPKDNTWKMMKRRLGTVMECAQAFHDRF
jgi:hypothetical protein